MLRVVVCSVAMIAFLFALNYGLDFTYARIGYWPFIAFCIVGMGFTIIGAYLYDRRNAGTHSQVVLPPKRNDHQL